MSKTALVLGSSGLIGSLLLKKLFNHPDYSTIVTIVRKPQQINDPNLIEIVTDFNSEINLGEAEKTLQKNTIKQLFLYRPSLLIGNRAEYRLAENISAKVFPLINFFLRGSLSKYKSIEAEKVAQSLIENDLHSTSNKVSILHYNEIINSINTTQRSY